MNDAYLPLFEELPYSEAMVFSTALDGYNNIVFFNSTRHDKELARYSFIAIDPFAQFNYSHDDIDPHIFDKLADKMRPFVLPNIPELPPFQGGIAGYMSYDLVRDLEVLPNQAVADVAYPKWVLGFYDLVLSIDHVQQQAWVVSSGFPKMDLFKRQDRARLRLQWFLSEIKSAVVADVSNIGIDNACITSNFTKSEYLSAVSKIINYIVEGDVFEVNLAQRFACALPQGLTPFQLYRRICERNPAPFAAYIRFDDLAIVSSSPERFIKVQEGVVETRPIKGTIKRSNDKDEDILLAQQLVASEKNSAENAMIVDLMRNDLSRVCLPHSVRVPQFCQLESYQNVHHLVSIITGTLRPNCTRIDLLKATIAGGSITGAPKIRAMEIIDELEPTRRGPYCGHALYLGFNGAMDSSILIRTYVISDDKVTFQGGGAVVLDSDPLQEYEETFVKVRTLMDALEMVQ